MAAASIWISTLLTMSIFAIIWLHACYMSILMVKPMFQKAAAPFNKISIHVSGPLQALQLQ